MKKLLLHFIHLFYPNTCAGCKQALALNEQAICSACLVALPYTHYWTAKSHPLEESLLGRIPVEGICAYLFFTKESITQNIFHSFKYRSNIQVGKVLGAHFGEILKENNYFQSVDYVVSVPLHKKKRRSRGYNQSEIIAQAMANKLEIPTLLDLLQKNKATHSQTKKNRWERWLNVENVFECSHPQQIENKHLLLVDDILTTGATLEACVIALQKNANVKISIAVLACVK